ncbi:MAG: hypothetical protein GC196_08400 [Hyphomonas sp.]|nr:hypothetical protein [Hyphomonas sp.]
MKFKLVKVAVIASVGVTLVGTAVAQGYIQSAGENLVENNLMDEDGRECISATTSEEGDGASKVYRLTIQNGCDQPIFGDAHLISSITPGGKGSRILVVPAGGQATSSCPAKYGCLGFTHYEVGGFSDRHHH